MNNNYVPEWYITPFQHLKYTLVRNQDQLDILFDDLSDTDLFMSKGCDAQVDFYCDGSMAIVHIKESERRLIEIHGLLLHEAVHIWQQVRNVWGSVNQALNLKRTLFKIFPKTYLKCMS